MTVTDSVAKTLSAPVLENISDELVAPVIPPRRRIVVLPLLVIDGDSMLRFVAIVHAIGTTVCGVAPVVLWVSHVRVVVKSVVVLSPLVVSPILTERSFLSLSRL